MRRASRRRSRGQGAITFAQRIKALGAVAHWDPSYMASDNGTDSSWTDRIGGHVLSSTSQATRLTYSSSVSGLNNRPGWSGVAANSTKLICATIAPVIDSTQPITIYAVRKCSSVAAIRILWSNGSTSVVDAYQYSSVQTTGKVRTVRRQNGGANSIADGTLTNSTSLVVETSVYTGSAQSIYENGVASVEGVAASAHAPVCDQFTLGALMLTGSYSLFWSGDIGDVAVFTSAHDAPARAAVEAILRSKYGL